MILARAVAAAAVLLLPACTSDAGMGQGDGPELFESRVDVDTPELRQLKRQAGLEGCPDGGSGANELPEVTLPCLGGGPDANLAQLEGPLVLNLWAQWCGPCREELPYYQRLHEQADGRLTVLGLDFKDTQPAAALDLLREAGVTYPSFADPGGKVADELRVRGLPVLVIVDGSGEVVLNQPRVIKSYRELRDLVERELDLTL